MAQGVRKMVGIAWFVVALVALATAASAQAYRFVPDPDFGSRGVADLLAVNQPGFPFLAVREVQPGPKGTVWVHYRALGSQYQYECEAPSYLARYLARGALDTGFGFGGFVPLQSPLDCEYPSLAVDGQLRPLVTWTSEGNSQAPSTTAITRYTAIGALDPTFGAGGVALVTLPCPGGNSVSTNSDPKGNLLLSFGCREDESANGWMGSPFHSYRARLAANGTLDTGFGLGWLLTLSNEPGWEYSGSAAVEPNGSAVFTQTTEYVSGTPQRSRLLRMRDDGVFIPRFQARTERSLLRVAGLAAPRTPEEAEAFVLRPEGGLIVGGDSDRGGWVAALRRDGSLDRDFGDRGYRRLPSRVRSLALDGHGRLFVLMEDGGHLSFSRLLANGNRDPSFGGREGQRFGLRQFNGHLWGLVSMYHGRPLLYFRNLGSCSSVQGCAEPAELRRFRIFERRKKAR